MLRAIPALDMKLDRPEYVPAQVKVDQKEPEEIK
jgi:hypothetical protein